MLALAGRIRYGMDDALAAIPKLKSPKVAVIDRIDKQLQTVRAALDLRAYRQELLASNIANADTPHFKARDIDFKGALQSALAGRTDGSVKLAKTSPRHLGNGSGQPYDTAAKYRTEFQPNVDGNTVNMDVERAAFAENAMEVEALLTFIRGSLTSLQAAIQNTP